MARVVLRSNLCYLSWLKLIELEIIQFNRNIISVNYIILESYLIWLELLIIIE